MLKLGMHAWKCAVRRVRPGRCGLACLAAHSRVLCTSPLVLGKVVLVGPWGLSGILTCSSVKLDFVEVQPFPGSAGLACMWPGCLSCDLSLYLLQGVFVTYTIEEGGLRKLKRIRFSRTVFSKDSAAKVGPLCCNLIWYNRHLECRVA